MPDLRKAAKNHWRRLQRSNGIGGMFEGVRDGRSLSGSGCIVLARIDGQSLSSRELIIDAESQDILVDAQEWMRAFDSPPQDGDIITYGVFSSNDTVAEVRPSQDSLPCFSRWMGSDVFRVHCKITEQGC